MYLLATGLAGSRPLWLCGPGWWATQACMQESGADYRPCAIFGNCQPANGCGPASGVAVVD
ncbi:protein of unknown function [Pseudomonas sp. JV551A1]|nr:protein of unknown function [Pseudomonas sp. JV551A1]